MATPLSTSLYATCDETIVTTIECTAAYYPHTDAGRIAQRMLAQLRPGGVLSEFDWQELQDAIERLP